MTKVFTQTIGSASGKGLSDNDVARESGFLFRFVMQLIHDVNPFTLSTLYKPRRRAIRCI
ncbi:hypothetical protein E0L21_02365 [Kosakonia quasisacchari]|uniref:Uncharacterized protein n=1 Tax=Kosakonia quasisacchari TaxID=2529380 RepID=A0A4R0HRA4_9ENTR|nr:hypothetical protein E0L21_02365 [Kosakonia quasisacchari]